MSNAAPSANGSEPSTGRDSKGRFTRGNPGGVGNPFARKVAQLRSALIERVTEQDIKDIAEVLILQARTGDHAAIKLLFQYVLGKPAPAADPDTVEIDEFQKIYAPQREIMEQFPHTIHSIPPGMVCAVTRIINELCVGQLRGMLETPGGKETQTAGSKFEIRMSKSETNSKSEYRNPQGPAVGSGLRTVNSRRQRRRTGRERGTAAVSERQ